MPEILQGRTGHYLVLIAVAGLLFLPNLGGASLWDIDEGNNAEAAREMLEGGNWVVPTFNQELRTDKPALLYWLQMLAYRLFGINEFSARLPSVLAALLAVLLTYELGRSMFDARAGLLAGLILASTVCFCAAAHFANPDALLTFGVTLTLYTFWHTYAHKGRVPYFMGGVATGIAVLAKGPVGLALPLAVILLFLLVSGKLRSYFKPGILLGVLSFILVAGPWYILVGVETKGQFLLGFLQKHNVNRFLDTMENHGGPIYYYLPVFLAGFFPWSIFIGVSLWHAWKQPGGAVDNESADKTRLAYRLLWCWVAVFVVFFSIARTKLPNYILPIYPATAVLTAICLERWRRGELTLPRWVMPVSLISLALAGIGISVGMAVAAGELPLPVVRGRYVPGLINWIWIGAVPLTTSIVAAWFWLREQRTGLVATMALTGVAFLGPMAAWIGVEFDSHKVPAGIARAIENDPSGREIRIGAFQYFQPSILFYCQRSVCRLPDAENIHAFMNRPLTGYLITPANHWKELAPQLPGKYRVVSRHRDFYVNREIVIVTNR